MKTNEIAQPSYRERAEAVRREVQDEIVKLFQDNDLTEVRLLHPECTPVSVMWFDHDGDVHDTIVVSVEVSDNSISLEVVSDDDYDVNDEDNEEEPMTVNLNKHDIALRNTDWLCDILDAVKEVINLKTE